MPKTPPSYLVVRDIQEKANYWTFPAGNRCLGTEVRHLRTGDYTLAGFEDRFCIERKADSGEYAAWVFQARCRKELERMKSFEEAYLFLEFSFEDLVRYPVNSGIPRSKWEALRLTPQGLVKAHWDLRRAYPWVRWEFVGRNGREAASSLFKRVVDGLR